MSEILGGSYYEVTNAYVNPHNYEAHHIWAKSAYVSITDISVGQGAAIRMEKEDHRITASWDNRLGAKEYRAEQRELIQNGKYQEAWTKEVKDIRSKLSDKYDQHLVQAEEQLLVLDKEKKIKIDPKFKEEIQERQQIRSNLEQKQEELSKLPSGKDPKLENKLQNEIGFYKSQLKEHYEGKNEKVAQQENQPKEISSARQKLEAIRTSRGIDPKNQDLPPKSKEQEKTR